MIYTYDTEFLEDGKTIELISIGIVAEDGREFYAVNAEMDEERIKAEPWLVRNVWSQLPTYQDMGEGLAHQWINPAHPSVMKRSQIATKVAEFLLAGAVRDHSGQVVAFAGVGLPELWAYYSSFDHLCLAWLFGPMMNLPSGIPMWTNDLMTPIMRATPRGFVKPDQGEGLHNALEDARWNMRVIRELQAGGFWI